jgi:putative ABC transport system substrate-binding protein
MKRREFIALLGGAAAPWPLTSLAQEPVMPVIGFIHSGSQAPVANNVTAFHSGLAEVGYVEGRNAKLEYRWAEGQYERLPALASDLVQREVAVIAAFTTPGAVATKAATSTIPVVFAGVGGDPVKLGLVTVFNRPTANVTGIYILSIALEPKRLEVLHELVPNATNVGYLFNPGNPNAATAVQETQDAAGSLGLELTPLQVTNEQDLDGAFAFAAQRSLRALLVGADPFFTSRRDLVVALAARHAIPAIYEFREFATAGGLMSYGTSIPDAFRQAGRYVGRILKGELPGELPVMQSTKVELTLNLKTAKALGIAVPLSLLGRADEVIE